MGDPLLFGKTQNAAQTPFDNTSNGFTSTDTQSAIEESSSGLILRNVPCDSGVALADAVKMISGTAQKAQADTVINSNLIGVVERKETSILCDIRVTGVSSAVFSGLDETKEFFLSASTAGLVTDVAPTGAGEVVVRVGQPFSTTEMMVNKGTRLILKS